MSQPANSPITAIPGPNGQVGGILQSLPLEYLFTAPLMSATAAQIELAKTTMNFIDGVGMDESGNVKNVSLGYTETDASGNEIVKIITVPLITMVNIPSLAVEKVGIDLVVEVDAMTSVQGRTETQKNSSFNIDAGASYKVGGFAAHVNIGYQTSAKLSSTTSNNDSLNTNAKYSVHIDAENKQPVGLVKLLDILNTKINTNATPTNATPRV
jgi:hypothetical protein